MKNKIYKLKNVALLLLLSSSAFASLDVKSIDIYKNTNFLNQKLDLKNKEIDLLTKTRLEDIKFILEDGCKVKNYTIINEDFKEDKLSLKIQELKKSLSIYKNNIKALNSNIAFLEKTSLSTLSNSNFLKETSTFIKKEIFDNYNEIYSLENSIKIKSKELNDLVKKRSLNSFSKLKYDIDCKSDVIVSYPFYNIKKQGFFDINYNSKEKYIDIKNLSFITQSSGYDFKNIDINLYSYNYINQLKPNKFYPKYLDKRVESRAYQNLTKAELSMDMVRSKAVKISKAPSFEYIENNTRSVFKATNISLKSGEKKEVLFSKDSFKAKDYLEIDAYSSSQAFYKVEFKSDKLFGVSNAKLYLDNFFIGRTNINEIKKNKKTSIFFSTNRFIDVKKELIKDMKEEPFFSINKLTSQKIWEYEITNNSNKSQKVVLLERVPVSKHEDIKVKLIGKTKETKLDKNGKIHFNFELKPNDKKIIEFGYEIEKPNE